MGKKPRHFLLTFAIALFFTFINISSYSKTTLNVGPVKSDSNTKSNSFFKNIWEHKTKAAQTSDVGTLKGTFQVTSVGAASYSIPITVPKGTADMAPALSVTYNSGQGNGLLGMGFNLEGLTAITRCPSNIAINGAIKGLKYTNEDHFCLNGEQLVPIRGPNGGDGTEYRTRIDSRTKIISYGGMGDGPAQFKVWTKGGQIATYGFFPDSLVHVPGRGTVLTWAVSKIEDTAGNFLYVRYVNEASGFYPSEIDYTYNYNYLKAHPENQEQFAVVKFFYEDRPDVQEKWIAGGKTQLSKRLAVIQPWVDNHVVYTYYLGYDQSPNTGRSRLVSIKQCSEEGVCLPPTTFSWQNNQEGWDYAPNYVMPSEFSVDGRDFGVRIVDLNGDGLPDIVQSKYSRDLPNEIKHAWINTGSGWQENPNYNLDTYITYFDVDTGVRFTDLNRDGLPDIIQNSLVFITPFSGSYINNGNGWAKNQNYIPPMFVSGAVYPGPGTIDYGVRLIDLNGDGIDELVQSYFDAYGKDQRTAYVNNGSTWASNPAFVVPPDFTSQPQGHPTEPSIDLGARVIDLNGDGLPDFIQGTVNCGQDKNRNLFLAWINTGSGYQESPNYAPPMITDANKNIDERLRIMDLNGDGLPDLIQGTFDGVGHWDIRQALINTGAGWYNNPNLAPIYITDAGDHGKDLGVRFADLNGDGLPDMIQGTFDGRGKNSFYTLKTWINRGTWWQENAAYAPPTYFTDAGANGKDLGTRIVDLNGDGLPDIIRTSMINNVATHQAWLNNAKKLPDYLLGIQDGLGARIDINYDPLTNKAIYTKEDGAFPDLPFQAPMYVVTKTICDTFATDTKAKNKNDLHTTYYTYSGARNNVQGLGFLGFKSITARDDATGITKKTYYSLDTSLHSVGKEYGSETRLSNGVLISDTWTQWDQKIFPGYVFLPFSKKVTTRTFDLDGTLLVTKATDIIIDDYGNPIDISSKIEDSTGTYITSTENTYSNDPGAWLFSLVGSKVTVSAPNASSQSRTSSFTYDTRGLLTSETTAPDDPKYTLTKTYQRDVFGNIIKTTITGTDIKPRESTTTYDPTGRFVATATNPLGHTIKYNSYDPKYGKPTEVVDENGLSTKYQYDGFGRLIKTDKPDGVTINTSFAWRSDVGATYAVETLTTGQKPSTVFFDKLDRKVAEATIGLNNEIVSLITYYDGLGRVSSKSLPYFNGKNPIFIQYQYDILGRITKTTYPNNSSTSVSYQGFATTTTNALKQKETKITNARNDLIASVDNRNNRTTYTYDAYSNLLMIKDCKNNITQITYDKYGRKIAIHDPDKGNWTYTYNVLGELLFQSDAMLQTTSFTYDVLGRMLSRTDKAGTSTWEYDTALHGIGKIAKEVGVANDKFQSSANKTTSDTPSLDIITKARKAGLESYTKTYTYDDKSRPSSTSTTINGNTFTSSVSYDEASRPSIETYPEGVSITKTYDQFGYLIKISDTNTTTKKPYWQLNSMDPFGHVLSETHSNGLITNYIYDPLTARLIGINTVLSTTLIVQKKLFPTQTAVNATHKHLTDKASQNLQYDYDDLGNLRDRIDKANNVSESFSYDDLNRLTQSQIQGAPVKTYQYDDIGNIVFKSGVGTYKYGEQGAGPHAVTSIIPDQVALSSDSKARAAPTITFEYNKNGDQVKETNGTPRNILYTSFSKPLAIINGKAQVNFLYDANRESFERVDDLSSIGKTVTTYYLGNYEHVVIDDGKDITTQHKYYLSPNTIYTKSIYKGQTTISISETLKDNLGSVTDLTDENANILQHFAYTPFGEQIQTKGDTPIYPRTHHGYTNHEEIEPSNLIHMNGRLYDPVIGRFLSADPSIQFPDNSQDLNRYSYCLNNPFHYIDRRILN